jgi:hypothetical protein
MIGGAVDDHSFKLWLPALSGELTACHAGRRHLDVLAGLGIICNFSIE